MGTYCTASGRCSSIMTQELAVNLTGDKTYANTEAGLNALKALIIKEDTTITAVVEKLYSVT